MWREQKFSKISTVSTDPVSRTTQNILFSYKEASCEPSWALSHVFIMVFSEWTAKGLGDWGEWSEAQRRAEVSALEGAVQRGGAAHQDTLGKGKRTAKAIVIRSGRTAHSNYRLVAAEELDLKESTVDLCMHWASSRCLRPAWWPLVQKHPQTPARET